MAKDRNQRYRGQSEEDRQILEDFRKEMREGLDWCEPIHSRCEDDAKFEALEQWSKEDADVQAARERPALPLDSLLKLINAVANREVMERISPTVFGVNEEDNGIAEALQEANRWQRSVAETEHEESMAFRRACASGYGVMHKWWDDTALDGHGMITDEQVPIYEMIWDSRARKQNLVDRRWHHRGRYIPVDEVAEQWGKESSGGRAFVKEMKGGSVFGPDATPTGEPVHSHRGTWGEVLDNRWFSRSKREVFVVEREWVEVKTVYKVAYPVNLDAARALVLDPGFVYTTPEGEEITKAILDAMPLEARASFFFDLLESETEMKVIESKGDFDALLDEIESYTDQIWEHKRRASRKYHRYAIVSNEKVLEKGDRPAGFTYEFMTGFPFETRSGVDWFGMVDVAKPAQDFKNKFYSALLTMYMMSPKQNLLIEEGAVGDTDVFLNEFAKVSGVTFVPDGFIQSGRYMTVEKPNFPPMLERLLSYADQAVMDVFGLSSIEMGTQGDLRRVSGNVVTAARQASNTLLASLFDSLRRYRRRWGMLSVKFLQVNYTPRQIARIVGPETGQYIQGINDWGDVNRFDIRIDESPTSVSEQMEVVDLLTRTDTLWKWEAEGKITFPEALDLLVSIPQSKRDRIKRSYEERMGLQKQTQEAVSAAQAQAQAAVATLEIAKNTIGMQQGGADLWKLVENQILIHQHVMPAMEAAQ